MRGNKFRAPELLPGENFKMIFRHLDKLFSKKKVTFTFKLGGFASVFVSRK